MVGIFLHFGPASLASAFEGLRWADVLAWGVLTLAARLALVETVRLPLIALGFKAGRRELFWFNAIRTFANQIVPLSGLAAFAQMLRRRLGITWSELAALASPQFVLALVALSVIGIVAVAINFRQLGPPDLALLLMYLAVFVVAMLLSSGAPWFIDALPHAWSRRATNVTEALRKLQRHPGLVVRLAAVHGVAILLRGGRIWILFAAAGVSLSWSQMLLVVAIAESTMLLNVTPGGLGIREGAILGAGALVGIPTDTAAGVAVLDRLLTVAFTVLLTPPALVFLRTGAATTASE